MAPTIIPTIRPTTETIRAVLPSLFPALIDIALKTIPSIPNSGGKNRNATIPQIRPAIANPCFGFCVDEICWFINVPFVSRDDSEGKSHSQGFLTFISSSSSLRVNVGAWQVGDLEGPSISCFSGSTSASPVLAGVFLRYQE